MSKRCWLCLVLLLCSLPLLPATAQGENLLQDPGFEDTSMTVVAASEAEGTTFAVNSRWRGWYTEAPRNFDWQNRLPNGTGRNNVGFGFVRSGNRSMELSRGFATFTAAVYQTVSVPAGSTVRGSAWYVMDLSEGADSQARVGIDPNGGTNPYDSDIVWSSWGGNQLASSGFRQLTVTTTATGPNVTLFLFATQRFPTEQNGIFWDDAELVVTEVANEPPPAATAAPGDAPAPPAATRTPVVVQTVAPNPDGSIIHQVQSGETLSSIAVAYGRSVDAVLALNPALGDGRLIFAGDLIVIEPRPGATPPPPLVFESATFTPEPVTATPEVVAQVDPTRAEVCALVYEDRDANGMQTDAEPPLAGASLALTQQGQGLGNFLTDGRDEVFCFEGLAPGVYTLTGSPPPGFVVPDGGQRLLDLQAGGTLTVRFGAVDAASVVAAPPDAPALIDVSEPDEDNGVIQAIGLTMFALAGLTLAFGLALTFIMRRRI